MSMNTLRHSSPENKKITRHLYQDIGNPTQFRKWSSITQIRIITDKL